MSTVIDVQDPDGRKDRHVSSAQTGEVEVRELDSGEIQIVGVHWTPEVSREGAVLREATYREEVLGTYPAGSHVEQIGH